MLNSKLNVAFWSIAGIEAIAIAVFCAMFLVDDNNSNHDGAQSMALFFFLIIPGAVLGLAILLHVFFTSAVMRGIALLIVISPAIILVVAKGHDSYDTYQAEQRELGRGYFSGRAMRAMATAVVQGDVPLVEKLAPTVDINTVGDEGVTLLWLATEMRATPSALVQTLLKLGANPNRANRVAGSGSEVGPALVSALRMKDLAVAKALLDAGADPNALSNGGAPMLFAASGGMSVETLRLLVDYGANVNATWGGTPLSVWFAMDRHWDLLSFLIERGVDVSRTYTKDDLRTAASFVATAIEDAKKENREPEPSLLRVQSLMIR
jgi:Ankyrin repeats (3 copies)